MPFPYFYFDPYYLLWISPALILAFLAQIWLRSAYGRASQIAAGMSGAKAARVILDSAGLHDVGIEQVGGTLSDHYDPRHKVLRLSQDVYHGRSMAAVGIAAHEAGHALQDAQRYLPLVVRNLAVPLANFGSPIGMLVLFAGIGLGLQSIAIVGLALFASVAVFQIINLPVEFDASSRAKRQLVHEGIVNGHEITEVSRVLTAAAMTYVAATLQSILQVAYFAMLVLGGGRRDSR
jgi:Zn-dependent membrane protease YugP